MERRPRLAGFAGQLLQVQIEHHVGEEEKRFDGIFAQARKSGLDMDALGEQRALRKQELMAEIETAGLRKPELTTMESTAI